MNDKKTTKSAKFVLYIKENVFPQMSIGRKWK